MADPKGPESGQAGGHSARPKPATLDLSATEVSQPADGATKPEPAVDPRKDTPKPLEAAKSSEISKSSEGSKSSEASKPAETAKPAAAPASGTVKPDAASEPKPSTTVPPAGAKPDAKPSENLSGGPRASSAKPLTDKPGGSNGAGMPLQTPKSRSGPGYGSVIASALAGAALAVLAIALFGRDLIPARPAADDGRVAAAEAKLDAMSGDLAALRAQLEQNSPSNDGSGVAQQLDAIGRTATETGGRVDAVEGRVKEIADKVAQPAVDPASVAALADRVDGVDVRLRDVATSDAVSALQARVSGAEAKADAAAPAKQVAAIESRIAGVAKTAAEAVEPFDKRLSAIESALKARPVGDPAARQVVALAALEQALEAGRPFPAELAAVKASSSSDNSALAALEPYAAAGAPTRSALAAELSEILAGLPGEKPADGGSVFSRFVANAGGIVKVTPKDASESGDARARLAALASQGDLEQALAARESADDAAKAATADWAKAATVRLSADKALSGARAAALSRLAAID